MPRFFAKGATACLLSLIGFGAGVLLQPAAADDKTTPTKALQAATGEPGVNDPLEPINRITSGFNAVVRDAVLNPLVDGYKAVTPQPVQSAISNAVSNISEPVTVGSSLLQGDTENAATATKRFIINSTIGLGGTSDPATDMGLKQHKKDFGQALGAGGVEPGPHVVLPILGPSNLRDATGDAITALVNPLPLAAKAASSGVSYSNNKDEIKALTSGALDPYVVERDAYEQNRRYEVNNGVVPLVDLPIMVEDDRDNRNAR
ncbi:MAG: VacJ family lipoprotein [Rhodospirillales bacterium]|nr:VacJ family lipoprotein [Rhodospirillales bacterium]